MNLNQNVVKEIMEKLQNYYPQLIMISNTSGRIIFASDAARLGEINLLAVESLNIRSKVSHIRGHHQSGVAMPLTIDKRRIGAVIMETDDPADMHLIEVMAASIELLYQEIFTSRSRQNLEQERGQFLYEWLHRSTAYSSDFLRRGKLFGLEVDTNHAVVIFDTDEQISSFENNLLEKILGARDLYLPTSTGQRLLILQEDVSLEKRCNRISSLLRSHHAGFCRGRKTLYETYQAAMDSLWWGQQLFPDEFWHDYCKLQLAIELSSFFPSDNRENTISQLTKKGKNAQLLETIEAFFQLNGDIGKICDKLHIHRNSIPYRLRRIREITGKTLTEPYDQLWIYIDYIR